MRISDWSSDVCSSDLASLDLAFLVDHVLADDGVVLLDLHLAGGVLLVLVGGVEVAGVCRGDQTDLVALGCHGVLLRPFRRGRAGRSEEHTSELQSLMRISYAVFCLKKKKKSNDKKLQLVAK